MSFTIEFYSVNNLLPSPQPIANIPLVINPGINGDGSINIIIPRLLDPFGQPTQTIDTNQFFTPIFPIIEQVNLGGDNVFPDNE